MKSFRTAEDREFLIREAESADMAEAVRVFRKVAEEKVFLETEAVADGKEAIWKERWKENGTDALFSIVMDGERQVGGIVLTRTSESEKNAHVRGLGMWLLDEVRSSGVGGWMLDYAVEWAKSGRKLRKIILGVYSSNFRAIRLYLSRGFSIEGSIRNMAVIDGTYVDEITMGLDLDR